ncbi:hypothetical protein ACPC54_38150 [Kitasatospora sp. NPDC094028]
MGLVTVDEDTGARGPARFVIRSLCHVLDVLPAFAGCVRPVVHPGCRTFADGIGRTVVVKRSLIDSIAEYPVRSATGRLAAPSAGRVRETAGDVAS